MTEVVVYPILLSESEATKEGAEGVYAIIRNDYAKGENGGPVPGKEYGYEMFGAKLHGPIPTEPRAGFLTAAAAEAAAKSEYLQWRSGNIPRGTRMKRHEAWRTAYRRDRYLEYLNESELCERYRDLMNNSLTLTDERKIGIGPIDEVGDYWFSAQTHVLEECLLRKYVFPYPLNLCKDWQYPNYDWPGIEQAAALFKNKILMPGRFLVKYGKREYLLSTYERGAVRVFPASKYSDDSLNRAIRDEELELSVSYHPSRSKNAILDQYANELDSSVPAMGNVEHTIHAPTNYYVYCLAGEVHYRLFADFEADCCLIINDPEVFINRLLAGVNHELGNWKAFGTGVQYIDPLNTTEDNLDVFFGKHFKFAYQREYRIIWIPPEPELILPEIDVELGSLRDCAELILL